MTVKYQQKFAALFSRYGCVFYRFQLFENFIPNPNRQKNAVLIAIKKTQRLNHIDKNKNIVLFGVFRNEIHCLFVFMNFCLSLILQLVNQFISQIEEIESNYFKINFCQFPNHTWCF